MGEKVSFILFNKCPTFSSDLSRTPFSWLFLEILCRAAQWSFENPNARILMSISEGLPNVACNSCKLACVGNANMQCKDLANQLAIL